MIIPSAILAFGALCIACFAILGFISFKDDSIPTSAIDHSGDQTIGGDHTVLGNTVIGNNSNINGDLSVDGSQTIKKDSTIGGVLTTTSTYGVGNTLNDPNRYYLVDYFDHQHQMPYVTYPVRGDVVISSTTSTKLRINHINSKFLRKEDVVRLSNFVVGAVAGGSDGAVDGYNATSDINTYHRVIEVDPTGTTPHFGLDIGVAAGSGAGTSTVNGYMSSRGFGRGENDTNIGLTLSVTTDATHYTNNTGYLGMQPGCISWSTDKSIVWECSLRIADPDSAFWAGLKSSSTSDYATDTDQIYFMYNKDAGFGTITSHKTNFHVVISTCIHSLPT